MNRNQNENATNINEARMEKKTCHKCRAFECDKFLVLLPSNQRVTPDLQQVRKLHICKITLTLNNKLKNLNKTTFHLYSYRFIMPFTSTK